MATRLLRTVSSSRPCACAVCSGNGAKAEAERTEKERIAGLVAHVQSCVRERAVVTAAADEIPPTPSIAALQRARFLAAEKAKDLAPAGYVPAAGRASDEIPPTPSIAARLRSRYLAEARSRIKEVL